MLFHQVVRHGIEVTVEGYAVVDIHPRPARGAYCCSNENLFTVNVYFAVLLAPNSVPNINPGTYHVWSIPATAAAVFSNGNISNLISPDVN